MTQYPFGLGGSFATRCFASAISFTGPSHDSLPLLSILNRSYLRSTKEGSYHPASRAWTQRLVPGNGQLSMKAQQQHEGKPRKIVGFHLDENLEWVAELECGHSQHVRHNPPWTNRHWVTTLEGRQQHLGTKLPRLDCVLTESRAKSDERHGPLFFRPTSLSGHTDMKHMTTVLTITEAPSFKSVSCACRVPPAKEVSTGLKRQRSRDFVPFAVLATSALPNLNTAEVLHWSRRGALVILTIPAPYRYDNT
jgi:hypothetical protein